MSCWCASGQSCVPQASHPAPQASRSDASPRPPSSLCPPPLLLQVLNKQFEVVTFLAQSCASFGKRDALVALGGLADKIHEIKHRRGLSDDHQILPFYLNLMPYPQTQNSPNPTLKIHEPKQGRAVPYAI